MQTSSDSVIRWNRFALLGSFFGLLFSNCRLTEVRRYLYEDPNLLGPLFDFASHHGLGPALGAAISETGLLPPAIQFRDASGVGAVLQKIRAEHIAKRSEMLGRLVEIAEDLVSAGIQVTLLKGAASLWTSEPSWRSMRDIDILVEPQTAQTALARLRKLGYRQAPGAEPSVHHLPVLIREDLPGWLELHTAPCNRRGEAVLPGSKILRHTKQISAPNGGCAANVLHPALHVLHGLVHHHFSNRGAAYGLIAPKGLLEFAHGLSKLAKEDVTLLRQKASENPRLAAAIELWIAAAADWLCLTDDTRFQASSDAIARWRSIRRRIEHSIPSSLLDAFVEDARMSLSRSRLAGSVAAGTYRSMAGAALSSVISFMREIPSSPKRRAEARPRATGLMQIVS